MKRFTEAVEVPLAKAEVFDFLANRENLVRWTEACAGEWNAEGVAGDGLRFEADSRMGLIELWVGEGTAHAPWRVPLRVSETGPTSSLVTVSLEDPRSLSVEVRLRMNRALRRQLAMLPEEVRGALLLA
ncbi:hypothetical protein [Actomonas aquatica]|uniref:Polyketide cyclase n=1 Tax=Actomonas aquatica TaxID=2866162 RepID=A0ABZ1C3F5_9BACT|nr:hypothetical protein [Opitutus sp. WL0086]WRQ85803.1 hypothetical protein K1X11_013405 [Opitutus sp. WL0086]